MSSQHASLPAQHTSSFHKYFLLELVKIISQTWYCIKFALFTFASFFLFLFTFEKVIQGVGFVTPFLVRYVLGEYLTLLPEYLVILLVVTPSKYSMPILGLSAFFSFFMVFLV